MSGPILVRFGKYMKYVCDKYELMLVLLENYTRAEFLELWAILEELEENA